MGPRAASGLLLALLSLATLAAPTAPGAPAAGGAASIGASVAHLTSQCPGAAERQQERRVRGLCLRGGGRLRGGSDGADTGQGLGEEKGPVGQQGHGVQKPGHVAMPGGARMQSRSSSEGSQGKERRPKKDKSRSLPSGWLRCGAINAPVACSRILSMKAPLDQKFSRTDHTPQSVRAWRGPDGGRIGLVVGLCFTDRYYNGTAEFAQHGVEHVSMPIDGTMTEPAESDVSRFFNLVSEFLTRCPNLYIAVHCTHGLNRSGYLIVSYLVQVLGMRVADALKAFAAASPPGLWDRKYMLALFRIHNEPRPSEEEMPAPPPWKTVKQIQRKERQVQQKLARDKSRKASKDAARARSSKAQAPAGEGWVVIMRGLPGSGKTTYVASKLEGAVVCSADTFFQRRGGGGGQNGYSFELEHIGEAHQACMASFLEAMQRKAPLIVVDNTHVRQWEYRNYVTLASMMQYRVRVIELQCPLEDHALAFSRRSVHGVPWKVVRRMWSSWQEDSFSEKVPPTAMGTPAQPERGAQGESGAPTAESARGGARYGPSQQDWAHAPARFAPSRDVFHPRGSDGHPPSEAWQKDRRGSQGLRRGASEGWNRWGAGGVGRGGRSSSPRGGPLRAGGPTFVAQVPHSKPPQAVAQQPVTQQGPPPQLHQQLSQPSQQRQQQTPPPQLHQQQTRSPQHWQQHSQMPQQQVQERVENQPMEFDGS